jgi:RecB family exonuclease
VTTLAPTNLRETLPVEKNVERPKTLRQTRLARFDNCPHSLFLDLKYKGGPASIATDRGSAFHLFMQKATELMIEQGEPTMPAEMGRELADAVMAENLDFVLPTAEQDAIRLMAWNWASATVIDLDAIVGVEVPLEMELGGFTVTGRIDRVEAFDSILVLRDAKTSLNIRKSEDVQRGFQGMLYGLLALEGAQRETGLRLGAGITDIQFIEEYPRYRSDEGPLIQREGLWNRTELLAEFKFSLERNLAALERSFETGEWPARDGSWCSICPAQSECPLPARLREVEQIETAQDAQDAFSRKLALDAEGRRLQAGMRGWVQENGAIYGDGDLVFDASFSESKSVKDWTGYEQAIRVSALSGKDVDEAAYVSKRSSVKYAKRKLTKEERDARPSRD